MFYQLHCHEIVFFWNCTWNQIFRKKSHFEEKARKYPQMEYFGFYQKFISLIFFCFDVVWSFYYAAKTAFLRTILWLFPKNLAPCAMYYGSQFIVQFILNRQDCLTLSQPAFTCSKSTIETLEQGVKFVQS